MNTSTTTLRELAYARSGDKGASANIGVIAHTQADYEQLYETLTAARVKAFFEHLDVEDVVRYELPNLGAINFVLHRALGDGGSRSLRIDAQGKALGQQLLDMKLAEAIE
jgi:hypothetical protein